jgi:hypothetical protein
MSSELALLKLEIAYQIQEIIGPYYKGIPFGDEEPDFRKSLSGDEILSCMRSLHNLSVKLLSEGLN